MTSARLTEDQLIAALRKGAATSHPDLLAAVEHLITHDFWLRRTDFVNTIVRHGDAVNGDEGEAWIEWHTAREAFDRGGFDRASSSELLQLHGSFSLFLLFTRVRVRSCAYDNRP